MNRITILARKAEKLQDKVVFEGEHELERDGEVIRKSYFSFKDIKDPPSITIACNGRYSYLESCSCTHCSVYGGITNMKQLCAYALAVYKSLGK